MCANGLNGQPCWAGRYNSLRKRPTRKPKTGHSITIYYYLDRHGRHPIQLGRDWQEVEERLFLSQKEKEILAFNQDATPPERLEERLRQMGKDAKTRPQKERLWRLVQDYLDAREGELEGGLRHMKQAWTNTVISPAEHQELDAQI
jgi:hypothetical protein